MNLKKIVFGMFLVAALSTAGTSEAATAKKKSGPVVNSCITFFGVLGIPLSLCGNPG